VSNQATDDGSAACFHHRSLSGWCIGEAARGQPDWARAINASVLAVRYVRGWGLEFEFVEQRFQHTLRRSPRKGLSCLWGTVTDESGKQGKGERFLRTCSGNANNRALPAKLCSHATPSIARGGVRAADGHSRPAARAASNEALGSFGLLV
jgi:hypothetical protein